MDAENSSTGIGSERIRRSWVSISVNEESVTSVRTSADAEKYPGPWNLVSAEYAPYVHPFCSRKIMKSRASPPPPST